MSYDDIATAYDAAFAWESEPTAILPVWRELGEPQRVLEVGCGPARLLATLLTQGAYGVGIDISAPMLELARSRLAATGGHFELHRARMEDVVLEAGCDGAFCAAGTIGHLASREAAAAHLRRMAAILPAGGRYAVQLTLKPLRDTAPAIPNASNGWDFALAGETLRYSWYGLGIRAADRQELQRSRIEWLTGPRRGEVIETDHLMAIWDWRDWQQATAAAGFTPVAALNPGADCASLPLGPELEGRAQTWHVLAR